MSSLETRKIEPATGTTVTLGAGGDTVLVSASQLKTNTVKDAGGNALFTSDGAGTFSSVNSPIPGRMIFISSQTASSIESISFTQGIDSTYDEYVFYFVDIHPADNNNSLGFQANAVNQTGYNETITSSTFIARHAESNSTRTLVYDSGPDQAQGTSFQLIITSTGNISYESAAGELHLFAPSSPTYIKHFYAKTSSYQHADGAYNLFVGGYFNTEAAITEIQFKMGSGGNFDGTIAMYGIL